MQIGVFGQRMASFICVWLSMIFRIDAMQSCLKWNADAEQASQRSVQLDFFFRGAWDFIFDKSSVKVRAAVDPSSAMGEGD